jgi:hypothetical protein
MCEQNEGKKVGLSRVSVMNGSVWSVWSVGSVGSVWWVWWVWSVGSNGISETLV